MSTIAVFLRQHGVRLTVVVLMVMGWEVAA